MSYFLTCLRFNLLQRLSNLRTWFILLLLPALVLAANGLLPSWHGDVPVNVGVVLPENGGVEMWQLLETRNDDVLAFVLTDADTLDRNIAAGRWDCGIVLAADFDQKVSELDMDRIFTLRIGPGSTVYPLVKETISACAAQLISEDVARDYLADSEIPADQLWLNDPDRVVISMRTLDGAPIQAPELAVRGTQDFIRWLICVAILVRMLFGAADLAKWSHSPGMKRTSPLRAPLCTMAARGTADTLLLFFSASVAMLLLGDGLWGCIAVLSYLTFWLLVSLLLAQFPKATMILHVFIPFAVVISLLMSSVLVDISLILPEMGKVIPWLPVTMFLEICRGSIKCCLFLFVGGCIALVIAWIASLLCRKN